MGLVILVLRASRVNRDAAAECAASRGADAGHAPIDQAETRRHAIFAKLGRPHAAGDLWARRIVVQSPRRAALLRSS
jgi:hypothetical protein